MTEIVTKIPVVLGTVVGAVIKSPLEFTNPVQFLSGDGVIGFLLTSIALLFISVVIMNEFELSVVNKLPPQILDYIRTHGSILVLIGMSMYLGIVFNKRFNRYQRSGNWQSALMPKIGGNGGSFFGGEDWTPFPNHPFFVTGSSEYNDKTVSDNHLPTL